jgi:hypothetical protein
MVATTDFIHVDVTDTHLTTYPIAPTVVIFCGVFVGEDGLGNARPLVAADKFLGISKGFYDNASGLAGAYDVEVEHEKIIKYPVTGVTDKTVNDRPNVYAADDDTLTLTDTGSLVGTVLRYDSGTVCYIEIKA